MFNTTVKSQEPKKSGFAFKAFGAIFLVTLLFAKVAFGQSTIYSQNFGTTAVNATTLIAGPPSLIRSGAAETNFRLATGSASSGSFFSGLITASGGANFADGDAGTVTGFYQADLAGINTTGFSSIQVGYIARKTAAHPVTLTFQWSNDGSTWNNITYTDVTNTSTWQAINGGTLIDLPAGAANQANLRFRWSATRAGTGGNYRIDDFIVRGVSSSPNIDVNTTSITQKFYANHTHPSQGLSYEVSGSNLTGDITIGPLTGYNFSTASDFSTGGATITLSPVAGTVPTTTIYVRLTGASVGTFTGNIPHTSPGATTKNVAVTGQVYPGLSSNFTAGNVIVLRNGENGITRSNAATPIFLDEYTPTGTLVQSLLMPVSQQGANNPIFMSGTATSEGYMNLSPDGKYLTFAGYTGTIHTTGIAATSATTNPRVLARVDYQGNVNTSTLIDDGYEGNNIRSAFTIDGNAFWSAGAGGVTANGGGVRYSLLGSTGSSVQVSTTNSGNCRVIGVANSQLFTSSGSGTQGLVRVGTGLPTNTGNSGTTIISLSDATAFVFLDRDAGAPGDDALYMVSGAGLFKYSSTDGGLSWTAQGSLTGGVRDLTAEIVSGNVVLTYITPATAGTNVVRRFTDAAAFDATITSSGSAANAVGSVVIPATTADVFLKGLANAPIFVATPEIALTQNNAPSFTVSQGTTNKNLYRVGLGVTVSNAVLTGVSATTAGSYVPGDIQSFSLVFSTNNVLDGGDPVIATTTSIPASGGTLSFTGLAQGINAGQNRWLFLVATISGCANVGATVQLDLTNASVNFASGTKTGSLGTGAAYTITAGALANPTGVFAPAGSPTMAVNFTPPPTCSDDIVIFVNTVPISGTPPVALPPANTAYFAAPVVPGFGRLVYVGNTSPQTITGLTVGTTYHVRVYNRFGTQYSSGVAFTYVPQFQGLFTRGSGVQTDPIFALTPTGTPATALSLGGFAADRNIIVQNGHTLSINASGIPVRDIVVQTGGTLRRFQSDYSVPNIPTDMVYFNLQGNIINNGTIGNGALFNALGFNTNGANNTITGGGVFNIGRLRKNTSDVQNANLTIDANVNITFPGTGLYVNNATQARLNVTVKSGKRLSFSDPQGSLAFDGTDGTGADVRAGSITVNGILEVNGTYYAKNDNTGIGSLADQTTNFIINPGGRATIGTFIADLNEGQGSGVTLNGRLDILNELRPVSGNFSTNNNLRLISTASNTGRISAINPGASVSGNVTLQRYVPNRSWHFIGHAVTTGQTLADWNDNFKTYGPMPGTKFPNPGPNTSSIFAYDDFQPSGQSPEINGWYVPTSANVEFQRGYRVHFGAAPVTFDNSGPIANGNVTTNLSYTGSSTYAGWNLIANPHPAPINWDAVTLTNTNPALVTFNPAINKYQVYLTSGNYAGAGYPTANTVINAAGNIVASNQAIFVRALGPGASVGFPQSSKASSAGTFYRTSNQVENTLRIKLSDNRTTDEAIVRFLDAASADYDQLLDVDKFSNPDFTVFTAALPGQKLAINSLAPVRGTEIVPVVIQTAQRGSFTLSFSELESFTNSIHIYLKDNYLGTVSPVTATSVHEFNITNDPATYTTRFELIFSNNSGITSNPEMFKSSIKLYPNPAETSNGVRLVLNGYANESVRVEISDLRGRLINSTEIKVNLSIETTILKGIDKLAAGTYLVNITSSKGIKTEKLVIK